jgi:hypothetical protein
MRPDELERQLRERLNALGPAPRAELLHVLMLPDFDRADRRGIHRSRALHPRAGVALIPAALARLSQMAPQALSRRTSAERP